MGSLPVPRAGPQPGLPCQPSSGPGLPCLCWHKSRLFRVWVQLWAGWRVSDVAHAPSLALRVLCRTMPCLSNCIWVSVLAPLCFTASAFIPCRELAENAGGSKGCVSQTPQIPLSDWQAGAQPVVEPHFPKGEGQQSGSRGTERAGVSSSQLPVLPFPVT